MSVITFPNFAVSSFTWSKASNAISFSSVFGSQSLDVAVPVWEVTMQGAAEFRLDAIAITTFMESLNGYSNQVSLWNLVQPVPTGTLRGSLTLQDPVPQGQLFIIPTGGASQAGKTVKAGDLFGIGSGTTQQVVRAAADAVADSTGAVFLVLQSPVRNAFPSGAAVTWDRPKALFRQKSLASGIEHVGVLGQALTLNLREDWRP